MNENIGAEFYGLNQPIGHCNNYNSSKHSSCFLQGVRLKKLFSHSPQICGDGLSIQKRDSARENLRADKRREREFERRDKEKDRG
jgi:hypothetical protein